MDRYEVAQAELVEALAGMVNRSIEDGKAAARSALCHIDVIRAVLAKVANLDDYHEDLEAAERALRAYLSP